MELDLQSVIDLVGSIAKISVPCGVIFGLSGWAISFFFDCAFPHRKDR